jgi:hypothetical protein
LKQAGTEYTTQILSLQHEETEKVAAQAAEVAATAAAAAAAQEVANRNAKKNEKPTAKKHRMTASAKSFQTAAALIAAGATASAPIDIDSDDAPAVSAQPKPTKKRKTGAAVHGAYAYTPLGEVESRPHQKLNFYGVIITARPVKKTQGADWCMSIVVSDMSLSLNDNVTFNIFRSSQSSFPSADSVRPGDIIRIHRAAVERYAPSGNKLVGTLTGKQSSFCIISGQKGDSIEPYFKTSESQFKLFIFYLFFFLFFLLSSKLFCSLWLFPLSILLCCVVLLAYSEVDPDIISAYRDWSHQLNFRTMAATASSSTSAHHNERYPATRMCQLDSMQKPFFDMYCAIIYLDKSGTFMQRRQLSHPNSSDRMQAILPLVYVWDGTDLPDSIRFQRALLPNGTTLSPSSTQTTLFGSGSVVTPRTGDIIPIQLPHAESLEKFQPPPGYLPGRPLFIKLRNVPITSSPDGFYIQFTKVSHVDILAPSDPHVQSMMTAYAQRQGQLLAQQKLINWSHITTPLVTPIHPPLPLTPIKWILSSGDVPAVAKYRIRARVLATVPHHHIDGSAAAANGAEQSIDSILPLQHICKFFCSACDVWSKSVNTHPRQRDKESHVALQMGATKLM